MGSAIGAGRASSAPGKTNAGAAARPRALEIDHDPQLFIDDHLVDNRWGVGSEALLRVVHAPRKHEANPVIPDEGGYVNVARDRRTGLFKMLYQVFWDISYN